MLLHAFVNYFYILLLGRPRLNVRLIEGIHVNPCRLIFRCPDVLSDARHILRVVELLHLNVLNILSVFVVTWLLGLLRKHIDGLIKVYIRQVRKVYGNSLFLDCSHQQERCVSTSHLHVCDVFGWKGQVVKLLICLHVPKSYSIVRSSKQKICVVIVETQMPYFGLIVSGRTDVLESFKIPVLYCFVC